MSSTPSPGGRWESHPLPGVVRQVHVAQPFSEPRAAPRSGRVARPRRGSCPGRGAGALRVRPGPGSRGSVTSRPATRTGNMFSIADRDAGAAPRCRGAFVQPGPVAALPSVRRVHHDQRHLRALARPRPPGRSCRSGRCPRSVRVSSRDGAWIAPISRPCSRANARMHRASWLSGSLVTITSTPVVPALGDQRAVSCRGRAKNAADENSRRGPGHGYPRLGRPRRGLRRRSVPYAVAMWCSRWSRPLVAFVFAVMLARQLRSASPTVPPPCGRCRSACTASPR